MSAGKLLSFVLAIVLLAAGQSSRSVDVYEDPHVPSKRTISLHIAVYPAKHATGDPVFLLTGGPGESSTVPQRFPSQLLFALRASRNLVFIDPRGTGQSNALKCDLFQTPQSHFAGIFAIDAVTACREDLSPRADVNLYKAWLAADDLDRVRAELGYTRIALYGDSYGAQVVLEYLRRYGNHVSAAVLSRAEAPGTQVLLQRPRSAQWALDALFRSCEGDSVCSARFPQLRSHFAALLQRFDGGYADVTVRNPQTGTAMTVRMGRVALVETVRRLLAAPDTLALLPLILEEGYNGNYEPLAVAKVHFDGLLQDVIASGVLLSEDCSERVPFITNAAMDSAAHGTFYGTDPFQELKAACGVWNVRPVNVRYLQPVRTGVPVLAISAVPDAALVRYMPRAHYLLLNEPLESAKSSCADVIVLYFFLNPQAKRDRTLRCASKPNAFPFAITLPASLSG